MIQIVVLVISALSLVGAVWCLIQLRQVGKRLTDALGNTDAGDLESQLAAYSKRVEVVDTKLDHLTLSYKQLTAINSMASQKISVVRFNPFGDTGGDQSFSLAVLDAHDSGYVLTSIHGREGTRVYVKPIDFGKSKYQLSQEEKQALGQAAKRVPSFKEVDDGKKD